MKKSAGILFIYDKKALLVHSTNASWWQSYTPPKGGIESNESSKEAASREVKEEIGIYIDPSILDENVLVEYKTPTGKIYKTVHIFIYRIKDLSEIGLTDEHVPFSMLQHEEIDEAKFLGIDDIKKKLMPRYLPYILPLI